MKIDTSAIYMGSNRTYQKTSAISQSVSMTLSRRVNGGKEANQGNEKNSGTQSGRLRQQIRNLEEENKPVRTEQPSISFSSEEDTSIQLLKKLLEAFRMSAHGEESTSKPQRLPDIVSMMTGKSLPTLDLRRDTSNPGMVWTREIKTSSFLAESEVTSFSSTGMVKTADGREISFNLELEMSRSFMQYSEVFSKETMQVMTDPLVINLDTSTASVTDQKFLFDLDADGTLDSISFTDSGSGFLALDKNGDGKINDGNELFGTKSGNGFSDLASYDKDKNGWIDETDEVFSKLKVWTKDKDGNDKLLSLTEAGVGAIYLGNVSTEFSLTDEDNNKNAQIRRTGIYLKENGNVGTVQHVDLAL